MLHIVVQMNVVRLICQDILFPHKFYFCLLVLSIVFVIKLAEFAVQFRQWLYLCKPCRFLFICSSVFQQSHFQQCGNVRYFILLTLIVYFDYVKHFIVVSFETFYVYSLSHFCSSFQMIHFLIFDIRRRLLSIMDFDFQIGKIT